MTLGADWGSGQVLLSMVWFFLFFIWIWLITVFADIFRSHDMGGGAKALWTIFVIVAPYLGVFVYLIARGHKMGQHAAEAAAEQDAMARQYITSVVADGNGKGASAASELERLASLKAQGVISDTEYATLKDKVVRA
jgi:hypothetical protein